MLLKKRRASVLLVVSVLILTALTCSGSITALHNKSPRSGHIELRISEEDGDMHYDILLDKNWGDITVNLDVRLETEEGSFTAVLVDGKGNRTTLKAASGEPADIRFNAITDSGGGILLQGTGVKARGVLLTIDYAGDNLPRRYEDPDFD